MNGTTEDSAQNDQSHIIHDRSDCDLSSQPAQQSKYDDHQSISNQIDIQSSISVLDGSSAHSGSDTSLKPNNDSFNINQQTTSVGKTADESRDLAEAEIKVDHRSSSGADQIEQDLADNHRSTNVQQCNQEEENMSNIREMREVESITDTSQIDSKLTPDDSEKNTPETSGDVSVNTTNGLISQEDQSKLDFSTITSFATKDIEQLKAMDADILEKTTTTLLEFSPEVLARHITASDGNLLSRKRFASRESLSEGLELLLLPDGANLREDIIERFDWFPLFVAATIVRCHGTKARCEALTKWLDTAAELYRIGNMMGLVEILRGLGLPAVESMDHVWNQLSSDQPALFSFYKSGLKQLWHKLRVGNNMRSDKVCVPCVYWLARILSKKEPNENWRKGDLLQLLETGRRMVSDAKVCEKRYNGVIAPGGLLPNLLDIFRTEHHMLVCLGHGAVRSNRKDRCEKVDTVKKIITMFAQEDSIDEIV